jgi:hypothetical protein
VKPLSALVMGVVVLAGLVGGLNLCFFGSNREVNGKEATVAERKLPGSNPVFVENDRQISKGDVQDQHETPLLGLRKNMELAKVENRIWDALEVLESDRIRLIGEQDRDTKNGTQTWYLIGIEQPNSEQIAMARSMIAEALDCVEASSREILDERISEMIEMYNTFGTQGKRAAIIQIPHDAEKQMVAYVYRSNNFEEEMKKLDPATPFSHRFDQLKVYAREDAEILDRFSKIIKNVE